APYPQGGGLRARAGARDPEGQAGARGRRRLQVRMTKIAVLGGGNLGRALALGWVGAGRFKPSDIRVTRRQADKLQDLRELGYVTGADNAAAIRDADLVVLAVQPQQLD